MRWLFAFALFGSVLPFSRPISWFASETLEWPYTPPQAIPDESAGAIVVLSGPHAESRYKHAAWLYMNWRRLPVLASVGRGNSPAHAAACGDGARRFLAQNGVSPSDILIEARSANTYEDALYAAETLHRKGIRRIVLVTEALHMLRAAACFERQGFEVIPAPCRYRTLRFISTWAELLPGRSPWNDNKQVFHEWIGLFWYMAKGYI